MPRSFEERDLALAWSGRWSLTTRILAVNIFALAMLAGGFFYLDSYRAQVIDRRMEQVVIETRLAARAAGSAPATRRLALLGQLGTLTGNRFRLYPAPAAAPLDSWSISAPHLRVARPRAGAAPAPHRPLPRPGDRHGGRRGPARHLRRAHA